MQNNLLAVGLCVLVLFAPGCAVTEPDDHDTARVRAAVADGGAVSFADLADDIGISESAVIAALPESMRVKLPADDPAVLFDSLGTLAPIEVHFSGASPGSTMWLSAPLFVAEQTRDSLTLATEDGAVTITFHPSDIVYVWLIRLPMEDGYEPLSVGFYGSGGEHVMSWTVDEGDASVRAFDALWEQHEE